MKKVFVSQPMNGLSDDQILETRKRMKAVIEGCIGEEVEIIDTIWHDCPGGCLDGTFKRLWYLGKSISAMGEADIVVFAPGWHKANGCKIERMVAREYRIPSIVLSEHGSHYYGVDGVSGTHSSIPKPTRECSIPGTNSPAPKFVN